MKAKTQGKKLTLNKKTIARLIEKEMIVVEGGANGYPLSPMPTCFAICTDTCS